ncbi:hypothetical protein NKI58_28780 [Mesorhizobium sp. M0522]
MRLPQIAGAHPRMTAMALGPEDFSAAVGAVPILTKGIKRPFLRP